jgi:hypothetical protein
VQRYRCRITRRTFSLLPDALLPYPYHYFTASRILTWLYALEAERVPLNTLAARDRIDRQVSSLPSAQPLGEMAFTERLRFLTTRDYDELILA